MNIEAAEKSKHSKRRLIAFGAITKGEMILISIEQEEIPTQTANPSGDK